MKKFISLFSSAVLALSAAPMFANAETAVPADSDIICGDVNLDGALDATDATIILRYYADLGAGCYTDGWDSASYTGGGTEYNGVFTEHKTPLTDEQVANIKAYGDMNGDGNVDGSDASEVLIAYAARDIQ